MNRRGGDAQMYRSQIQRDNRPPLLLIGIAILIGAAIAFFIIPGIGLILALPALVVILIAIRPKGDFSPPH